MKGDFRLIVLDNTPEPLRQKREDVIYFKPSSDWDGISSGETYDYGLSLCTSDIVGVTDTDNYFLDPNLLEKVELQFADGAINVGCAGFYDHFQSIFDVANPLHRGELAPVLWGMFIDRKLALEDTWVCEPPGIGRITQWRTREKIIDQNMLRVTWPGFYPWEDCNQVCAFGPKDKPNSIHLLKGSSSRAHMMPSMVPRALEWGKAKWQ